MRKNGTEHLEGLCRLIGLVPGSKNETAKGKSKEQYLPQEGASATKGESSENQFNLADFIPGPSQDDSPA